MDIKEDLLLWFTNFLIKTQKVVLLILPLESNEKSAEELIKHKPINKTF